MKNLFLLFLLIPYFNYAQPSRDCSFWEGVVKHCPYRYANNDFLKKLNQQEVEYAIECLLNFEKDYEINNHWWEYTDSIKRDYYSNAKGSTSLKFNSTSNQVIALYLISALYYQDFNYCRKIEISFEDKGERIYFSSLKEIHKVRFYHKFIRKSTGINKDTYYKPANQKHIKALYKHYRTWYNELEYTELSMMRINNIHPLKGTIYQWR